MAKKVRRSSGKFGWKNIKANLKKATEKSDLMQIALGFIGVPLLYLGLVSAVREPTLNDKGESWLDGWLGAGIAFGITWFTGAAFNVPALRYGAAAVLGTHIGYAKLTKTFSEYLKINWWRFGGDFATPNSALTASGVGTLAQKHMISPITGKMIHARPAPDLKGYFDPQGKQLAGAYYNEQGQRLGAFFDKEGEQLGGFRNVNDNRSEGISGYYKDPQIPALSGSMFSRAQKRRISLPS